VEAILLVFGRSVAVSVTYGRLVQPCTFDPRRHFYTTYTWSTACLVLGRGHQHHGARHRDGAVGRQIVKKTLATEIVMPRENETATANPATNLRRAVSNGKKSDETTTAPTNPSALSEGTETVRNRPGGMHRQARDHR
jgi:hypothetical protein